MARPKLKECSNCHGKEDKCKFKITGRPCRIGKAKGKTKGKSISEKTKTKRDKYDSKLGDFHTDYLNRMRDKQINIVIDEETGEIYNYEASSKVYSFERYLNLIGEKTLASYLRYNYENLEKFDFKDFNTMEDEEINKSDIIDILNDSDKVLKLMIKFCSENNQDYMTDYIIKLETIIKRYKKMNLNVNKYINQYNVLSAIATPENAKKVIEEQLKVNKIKQVTTIALM